MISKHSLFLIPLFLIFYTSLFSQLFPEDPFFSENWGLDNTKMNGQLSNYDIDAPEAWEFNTSCLASPIAMIDNGFGWQHEDLKDNIWHNMGEDADGDGEIIVWNDSLNAYVYDPDDINGIDDDNNGYADDFVGWNFRFNSNIPGSSSTHGRETSGILAAKGDNDIGVSGVCWEAKLMLLTVSDEKLPEEIAAAIRYAVDNGARISNHSYGENGLHDDQVVIDAINYAEDKDHLIVAASGNTNNNTVQVDRDTNPKYPCNFRNDNIICVNQMDSLGKLRNNPFGIVSIDLTAPGYLLKTTSDGNPPYATVTGSSLAAPMVAGAAGILMDMYPEKSSLNIKEVLLNSVQPNAQLIEKNATGGHLNLHNAIQYIQNEALSCRARDSLTLLSLYNFTDGPNWTNTWDLNQPMNAWHGVDLHSDGCVRLIDLQNNNLNGSIPPNLGDLSQLEHLKLIQNNLSGSLPNSMTKLSNIKTIELHFMNLSGEIPEDIGKLQNLEVLTISGNKLKGAIPSSLGSIESLHTLYVNRNQLTGCFSPNLRSLCDKPNITNNSISKGNSFDTDWNSFCIQDEGFCDERIDFENYDFCKRQTTVTQVWFKYAGVVFNKNTNTFLTVNSTPSVLYETDLDGQLIRQIELLGFGDTEGITMLNQDQIAILEEGGGNIVIVDLPDYPISQIQHPGPTGLIHFPSLAGTNDGLEGITYDKYNDILYYAVEDDPNKSDDVPALFSLHDPLTYIGQSIVNPISPWDIDSTLLNAGIANFSDIVGLTMTSMGTLLVISKDAHMVVELDPESGELLDTLSSKIPTYKKSKLSGITTGPHDEIIITDHWLTSLIFLEKNCQTDCKQCGDIILTNNEYIIDFETDPQYCNPNIPTNINWTIIDYDPIPWPGYDIPPSPSDDAYFAAPTTEGYGPTELVLPCIDLYNFGQEPVMKLDFYNNPRSYTIFVSKNDGQSWKKEWSHYKNSISKFWTNALIPLSDYEDESILIKISAETNQPRDRYAAIDNVEITTLADCGPCSVRDSLALVEFNLRANGANWINKWNLSDPMSTWFGVELNNEGCVKRIELDNNNLSGFLSISLYQLFFLEVLNLSNNNIRSNLEGNIKNLENLRQLNLVDNIMLGEIPYEIGECLDLEQIIIANNDFTGSIPPSIINLSKLVTLRIQNNNLSGCYHPALESLCEQYAAWMISNNNNFNVVWGDFCDNDQGACEIDCEDVLNLSGIATSGDYTANQELNSTQTVDNVEVNYGAYEEVTLGIGFEVTSEATFSVTIEGCN